MIFKQINKLQQIDQLIRQKRTGNAQELGKKLGISRRQAYYWLEYIKDLGLDITYNRDRKTYEYESDCKLEIVFNVKVLSKDEIEQIEAGYYVNLKNHYLCNFFAQPHCNLDFEMHTKPIVFAC